MSGPWEKYASQGAPQETGPWSRYSSAPVKPAAIGKEGFEQAVKDEYASRNWADRQLIAAGTALGNVIERGKQVFGKEDKGTIQANRIIADENPGAAIAGNVAMLAPTALIPGANTYTGSMLIGGSTGLMQPTLEGESTAKNVVIGTAGGAAGKYLGDKVVSAVTGRAANQAAQQSRNVTRDAAIGDARTAGYTLPPSMADAGVGSRLLEGLSGKYKTNQLATIKNQPVTDSLVRKAVGLGEADELTAGSLKGIRQQAFDAGYMPVRNAGTVQTDAAFIKSLDDIVSKYTSASKSFPGGADDTIAPIVDGVRVKQFDAADAVDMVRILRERADDAFGSGKNAAAKANRDAAKAIEDQLERHLTAQGNTDALTAFRDARKLIAKTHTVEGALEKSTGRVDAKKIGRQLEKGRPLSGELETVGKFGSAFKDVAGIPKSGNANPLTILDYGAGASLGAAVDPTLMALPLARVAARYGMLSPAYQQAFVNPQYGLGLLANTGRLAGPLLPGSGGALALEAFR